MSLFRSSRKRIGLLALSAMLGLMMIHSLPPARAADGDKPQPRLTAEEAFLSNNLLRIFINEGQSRVWQYQYSPGSWGESNYHELFAIYTPAAGIVESPFLNVDLPFDNPGGGPGSILAILSNDQFSIRREVTLLPDDARYLRINYEVTNKSAATIEDVRFFQAVDFDIPWTGDHLDDYGWYDPSTDYIGVRDDQFFRNIVVSVPHSDNHSVNYWYTQIYEDWDDGNLAGRDTFGPGDPAVAKQFNFGDLSPNQSKQVTFYFWFGDPTSSITCVAGQVFQENGTGLAGATVKVINQSTLQAYFTETDADGNYQLEQLAPGTYSLNISKPDYRPYTTGFSVDEGCVQISPWLQRVESTGLVLLAQEKAPDIYQDTDAATTRGDFITKADYDGNWNGLDNWQNLFALSQPAYVYWDGASTTSHHFLKYYLFYPRDWGDVFPLIPDVSCTTDGEGSSFFACHENDLEGFAIAVNAQTNEVEYMVTRQHGLPAITCRKNLLTHALPINVRSDKMGHATYCVYSNETPGFSDGTGVIYRYGDASEVPSSITDNEVLYDLIHVDDLRAIFGTAEGAQAYTPNTRNFMGNDWGLNKASTPWALTLSSDVPPGRDMAGLASDAYEGDLYADPARLFASLFPEANISTDYTFNPNLTSSTSYLPQSGSWAASPAGDVALFLPFGAIATESTVVVGYNVADELPTRMANHGSLSSTMLGRPFVISAQSIAGGVVTAFNAPARLEASYSQSDLEILEASIETLQIAQWLNGGWLPLPTEVDEARGLVLAHIEGPGTFALFAGDPNAQPSGALFLPVVLYRSPSAAIANGDFQAGTSGWGNFSWFGQGMIADEAVQPFAPVSLGLPNSE